MKPTPENPPFEGNLIRAQDYAPCGCSDKPHWSIGQDETGAVVMKACPGRMPVEPYESGEGEVLGWRLVKR